MCTRYSVGLAGSLVGLPGGLQNRPPYSWPHGLASRAEEKRDSGPPAGLYTWLRKAPFRHDAVRPLQRPSHGETSGHRRERRAPPKVVPYQPGQAGPRSSAPEVPPPPGPLDVLADMTGGVQWEPSMVGTMFFVSTSSKRSSMPVWYTGTWRNLLAADRSLRAGLVSKVYPARGRLLVAAMLGRESPAARAPEGGGGTPRDPESLGDRTRAGVHASTNFAAPTRGALFLNHIRPPG